MSRSTIQTRKQLTLTLVKQDDHVLLGMKKRGFGEGRWNGFGGKVEENEGLFAAASRELKEESGITAKKLHKIGELEFYFVEEPDILEVHVFKTEDYHGDPTESEEMRPQWFHTDEVPFKEMWPDDIHWFPLFLAEKCFTGRFVFQDHHTIIESELRECEGFLVF